MIPSAISEYLTDSWPRKRELYLRPGTGTKSLDKLVEATELFMYTKVMVSGFSSFQRYFSYQNLNLPSDKD
jgi:hypothetical protein